MEFILNNSPELSMADITRMLFNQTFLSDVQFHVGGKTIYAHTLELMKRSIVFQKQLISTLGDNKLIPISDVSYDNFYQFVQFLYTDECKIDNANAIELFKLAKQYKVIKLENEIIRVSCGAQFELSLYEYSLMKNDELHLRRAKFGVINDSKTYLTSDHFVKVHSVVVEDILKSEEPNLSELELYTTLTQWIDQNSKDDQIEIHQQRDHYNHLIRLIRFSVMTAEELFHCTSKYPHLFNDGDRLTLYKQFENLTDKENKSKRKPFQFPYSWKQVKQNEATIFTVSSELLLIGLWFGGEMYKKRYKLIISQSALSCNKTEKLIMNCAGRMEWSSHLINLSDSIRLIPNMQYTIQIVFLEVNVNSKLFCRKENVELFTNVSRDLIQFEQVSENMFEMYFKMANCLVES